MLEFLRTPHGANRARTDLQLQHNRNVNAHHLALHTQISRIQYFGKMAGAVGNYNAHMSAYPDVAWDEMASSFVGSLGLQWNPYVTQVCTLTCFPLRCSGQDGVLNHKAELTGHHLRVGSDARPRLH